MNKRFIHTANKKRARNFGSERVDQIQTALTKVGFFVTREPTIYNPEFSTSNDIRNPDLKINFGEFTCYLESDGVVHGDLENPTHATIQRNNDFKKAQLQLIIINHETIKYLKRIFNIDVPYENLIGFLAAYMVLAKYSWSIK